MLRACDKIVIAKMKKWMKVAVMVMAFALVLSGGGCTLTPIHARTIEEIRGTYSIKEYYVDVSGEKTNLMGEVFDYLYLVIRGEGIASVVYKSVDQDDYYAREMGYTLKYDSASTTKINEIKLRFELPCVNDEVMYVNYLTVSENNTLACIKAGYVYDGEKKLHKAIYMSVRKRSEDVGYDFIESRIGHKLENIISPYSN